VWGEWGHEGVEPRVAQGAVMSGSAKGPFIGRPGERRRREAGDRRWSLTPSVSKSKRGRGVDGVPS
jgi:hypothetical protein